VGKPSKADSEGEEKHHLGGLTQSGSKFSCNSAIDRLKSADFTDLKKSRNGQLSGWFTDYSFYYND
jgi:hypothetical protein